MMFADLVGFTALSERIGSERAYLIVTECLKRLDAVARRHGGAVDKYLGDCLMAVFGHPVPLQDHAGAAVESALEMLRLVDDYARDLELEVPLEIRIGVNTGSLVAGDLRGRAIREFHVLGDAVNVAARLKGRAPLGHVYIGAGTEAETRGRFDYRRLESMQLKGKQERVETFEVSGSQRSASGSDS
ncbi:MAG: adenylate/guanylate cyclase domain-containing protein, partial [Deltaproteobacteria bacterium]|nr:adenylate/guanylate cyclase domain-containing protein [Deltaproteobacteria bacterium]